MVERLTVPESQSPVAEQLRQLALAVAGIHYVLGTVVENAKEFVPGEAVDEITEAWRTSGNSLKQLVEVLYPSSPNDLGSFLLALKELEPKKPGPPSEFPPIPPRPPIEPPPWAPDLRKSELLGDPGRLKISWLARLKDTFLMYWNSEPRTEDKRQKSREAVCEYLELASTVVSSIPQYERVVELISVVKQLVGIRSRRGV
jgi:hypothetical protein